MSELRGHTVFLLGVMAALILVAYAPSLASGFIWDDDAYVTENPHLRSVEGLRNIWLNPRSTPQWYPLVFTGFWMEWRLWGGEPFGYHLTNIFLHLANAVLLYLILRQLRLPGDWAAALIFALHPIQVESVAWVTERKNTLSTFFCFAALLAYLRFSEEPEGTGSARVWRYALSLVLFVGALLSKSVTAVLPAAILVILWRQRGRIYWRDTLALAPFLALGIAAGFHTAALEREHVGASGAEWALTPYERIIIAGRAVWFYVGKLLFPARLSFIYSSWNVDAAVWRQFVWPAALIGLFILLWLKRRMWGRGPLAAALIFVGALAPALGFLNVYPMRYSFVADHFQYLAGAAFIAAAGAGASKALKRAAARKAAMVIIVALTAMTWHQQMKYAGKNALWQSVIQHDPRGWIGHNNYGALLVAVDPVSDAALAEFSAACDCRPDYAETYNNLAAIHLAQRMYEAAIADLDAAIEHEPRFSFIYARATAHAATGNYAAALRDYDAAARLNSNEPKLYANRAVAHCELGEYNAAWRDVARCRALGGRERADFLKQLQIKSGRRE